MGVDTRIYLSPGARVKEVAEVIGLAAGLPGRWEESGSTRWYAVPGVRVSSNSGLPECCDIEWVDQNGEGRRVLYHFEAGGHGCKLLMPRSTPFWIAIGRRLVDFFGGWIDYQDCDEEDMDYRQPLQYHCCPEDGEPWKSFRQRMSEVQPITRSEYERSKQYAAYPDAEWSLPNWHTAEAK